MRMCDSICQSKCQAIAQWVKTDQNWAWKIHLALCMYMAMSAVSNSTKKHAVKIKFTNFVKFLIQFYSFFILPLNENWIWKFQELCFEVYYWVFDASRDLTLFTPSRNSSQYQISPLDGFRCYARKTYEPRLCLSYISCLLFFPFHRPETLSYIWLLSHANFAILTLSDSHECESRDYDDNMEDTRAARGYPPGVKPVQCSYVYAWKACEWRYHHSWQSTWQRLIVHTNHH